MSYILDALKKADRERKQGEIPDLKSISPVVVEGMERRGNLIWPVMAIALVAVSLSWFKPWEGKSPDRMGGISVQQPAPLVATPAAKAVASERSETAPRPVAAVQRAEAVKEISEPQSDVQTTQAAATQPDASTTASNAIPGIMELPASIRNSLPAIKISGHIYDENPSSRMVIINDKVMHEGKYLVGDLMIEEITDNGIVLNQSGTLFSMTTFDSWPR